MLHASLNNSLSLLLEASDLLLVIVDELVDFLCFDLSGVQAQPVHP